MQPEQSPLSDSYIQSQQHDSLIHYKIWLSPNPQHFDLYLTLRNNYIVIGSKQGGDKSDIWIKTIDFIGYNEESVSDQWTKITLNSFAKKKKFLRKQRRYLFHYTIHIYKQQFGNQKIQQLRCRLLSIANNYQHKQSTQQKRLMIYFNPHSGSNSQKHFDRILDFMQYTNCELDFLRTERRNHCKEHIDNQLDMKKYHGIVIVSGDGLMHEFVNSKAVGVVPVTHVPAGSGNAFAKQQMTMASQACEDEEAMFLAVKGRTRKLNLAQFNLQKIPEPIYSFLSFQWCFMADIDLNSEFLRYLGGLRFEVYGVWRLIKLKKHSGKLSYSTTSTELPSLNTQLDNNPNFKTQQNVYLNQLISLIPWVSTNYQTSPLLNIQDEVMDMQLITEDAGRLQLTKYMLNCQSGNHFDREKGTIKQGYKFQWEKIKAFRLQPTGGDGGVFGIDGERYEAQKIQARICEKKVLTFT